MSTESKTDSTQFSGYAVYAKGEPFKPFAYTPRKLGANDIEIKISHCGICHSDIHTVDSGWGPTIYPVIVGHEIVGEVVAVGSAVTKHKLGDRVGVGAQVSSCLECKRCEADDEQHCHDNVFTYNSQYPDGEPAYGGYQERVRVPEHFAFTIPESLESKSVGPLLCAGATVFSPLDRYGAGRERKRVGVIGIGGLGHLAIQFAAKMGAEVTAISTSTGKKADAEAMGAKHFLVSTEKASMNAGARSLDLIINTASDVDSLDAYFGLLDIDGVFVQVGIPEKPLAVSPFTLIANRLAFTGSLIGSPKEIVKMLQFAADHKVVPWVQIMPMDKVNEGYEIVRANKARFRVVLEN